jgi:shikimate dehydrogenase
MIHEWGLRMTGLSGDYVLLDLSDVEAERLIRSDKNRWDGLNVTTPHKPLAASCCDLLSEPAKLTDAANTLHWKDGKLYGENTDVDGFRNALRQVRGQGRAFQQALVIGSGGAARAVLLALSMAYPTLSVTVAARDIDLAKQRTSVLASAFANVAYSLPQEASSILPEFDLVIQATPVGSYKVPGSPLPLPLIFAPNAHVMDLVYAPRQTSFLAAAASCGTQVSNGLLMLLAQAAASFELWSGRQFPLEKAMTELLPRLEQE